MSRTRVHDQQSYLHPILLLRINSMLLLLLLLLLIKETNHRTKLTTHNMKSACMSLFHGLSQQAPVLPLQHLKSTHL
jgi:hypothetical protein